MKIQQSTLQKALQKVSKAVSQTPVFPAISNYHFVVKGDKLTIAATNMKFHISTVVEVSEAHDIDVLINAALLSELIRGLPDQPITFDFGTNIVTITYNQSGKTILPTEPGKDFPKPETLKTKNTLVLDSGVLLSGLNRSGWAVASERPDKPALECINMVLSPGSIAFAASGGFELATYTYEAEHKVSANLLIPNYCLNAFDLPESGDIAIIIGDKSLSIQYDNTTIVITLFDGQFPDVSSVIPGEQPNLATVVKAELLPVINRVKTFANKTTKQLRLSFSDGFLNIRAENIDFGHEAEEQVKIDYVGDPIEIGVPSDKFLAGIKNMGDTIFVSLSSPKHPIVMRDEQVTGKDNLTMVMPSVLK